MDILYLVVQIKWMASYFETWLHLSTLVYFSYLLRIKNFKQISYIISFPKSISK